MAVTRDNNLVSQRILVDLGFQLREIREVAHGRLVVFQLATEPSP
jgi:hypothetical protein